MRSWRGVLADANADCISIHLILSLFWFLIILLSSMFLILKKLSVFFFFFFFLLIILLTYIPNVLLPGQILPLYNPFLQTTLFCALHSTGNSHNRDFTLLTRTVEWRIDPGVEVTVQMKMVQLNVQNTHLACELAMEEHWQTRCISPQWQNLWNSNKFTNCSQAILIFLNSQLRKTRYFWFLDLFIFNPNLN